MSSKKSTAHAPTPSPRGHRTRVGAERRKRTLAHLLESALLTFAEHGHGASIDQITSTAGISRGTFYNYFRTSEEVLSALGDALADELSELLESLSPTERRDPVLQLGTELRIWFQIAHKHAIFCAFLWRAAFHSQTIIKLLQARLPRKIASGKTKGQLAIKDAALGFHVVVGVVLSGAFALSSGKPSRGHTEQLTRSALMALGAAAESIDEVFALPLARLSFPAESLLGRTQQPKQ